MQKRYLCWGCRDRRFDTLPDMLRHLEDGRCNAGWKIQHINALVDEWVGSQSYVIQNERTWLLAGAPYNANVWNCYDEHMRVFSCPECRSFSELDKHIFARHLQECCGYPFVLQCPHCPIRRNKFFRVSELLEHVEGPHCLGNKHDEIWENLRHGLWKNLAHRKTQYRLNRCRYKLLPAKRRWGKRGVHVEGNDENWRQEWPGQ